MALAGFFDPVNGPGANLYYLISACNCSPKLFLKLSYKRQAFAKGMGLGDKSNDMMT